MKFGRMLIWAFALEAWASNVCEAETSDEAKVRATAGGFSTATTEPYSLAMGASTSLLNG
jgi:hypothetical protein